MNKIIISDATLRLRSDKSSSGDGCSYGFKSVVETAKLLDRAGVDVIEMGRIRDNKTDTLILKTVAAAVKNATISVAVDGDALSIDRIWETLRLAKKKKICVTLPVSAVQMEYMYQKKPDAMIDKISELVGAAAGVCDDVEFSAVDATRSDTEFLARALGAAVAAGAKSVTLCDSAGVMLPWEFAELIQSVHAAVGNAAIGAECSDGMGMGIACAMEAIRGGCTIIKTSAADEGLPSLNDISYAIEGRADTLGAEASVSTTSLRRISSSIASIWNEGRGRQRFESGEETAILLDSRSDISAVRAAAETIGYDLSDADLAGVYELFSTVASKKKVGKRELEAIIAGAAMQVPQTYVLESYVINSGNIITSTANIVLKKGERTVSGVSVGDGPIDAAFHAIEQVIGHHYELDDFQIESVTEGREAVGDALVKLRSQGKLYSGRGISTDIVGASIAAYVSALNKIVFEEHQD